MPDQDKVVIRVSAYEDLLDRIAKFDSFTIAGRVYSADYLIPMLTINAADLISEAAQASAFALSWGLEAARARRFAAQAEAAYRQWRDRTWIKMKSTPNPETGKFPTDALCEKAYRTSPEYGAWRARMDDAQYAAEMAEAILEAFKVKAQMIKTEQELLRIEAGGPYVVIEDPPRRVARQPKEGVSEDE